jgi:hypothetical protein
VLVLRVGWVLCLLCLLWWYRRRRLQHQGSCRAAADVGHKAQRLLLLAWPLLLLHCMCMLQLLLYVLQAEWAALQAAPQGVRLQPVQVFSI